LATKPEAQLKPRTYGQVGAVMSGAAKSTFCASGKASGRLAINRLSRGRSGPAGRDRGGSGVNDCQNPCKTVPFKPKTEAEQAIIASWQALETGVRTMTLPLGRRISRTNSSCSVRPMTTPEQGRSNRNSQFAEANRPRFRPAPLVSAQMFDLSRLVLRRGSGMCRLIAERSSDRSIIYQTTTWPLPECKDGLEIKHLRRNKRGGGGTVAGLLLQIESCDSIGLLRGGHWSNRA